MNTKLNTHKICILAMLIAIAFVLGALSIRIGAGIKISFKFIPIFVSSCLFGPVCGGLCGALSDLLSYVLNPGSGPFMPQITFVEFLYGFMFGLFFYKSESINKKNILKTAACILLNTLVLSLGVMSFILMELVGLSYTQTLIMRLLSSSITMIVQFFGILALLKYMPFFKRFAKINQTA